MTRITGQVKHVIGKLGGMKALKKRSQTLDHGGVKVGVPGSLSHQDGTSLAMIAAVHEFGNPEKGIPERSFLRGSILTNRKKYADASKKLSFRVLSGDMQAAQAYGLLGQAASDDVKQFIREGDFVPNAPATVARKGSSKPLIDTGQLRQSITFVVDEKK